MARKRKNNENFGCPCFRGREFFSFFRVTSVFPVLNVARKSETKFHTKVSSASGGCSKSTSRNSKSFPNGYTKLDLKRFPKNGSLGTWDTPEGYVTRSSQVYSQGVKGMVLSLPRFMCQEIKAKSAGFGFHVFKER